MNFNSERLVFWIVSNVFLITFLALISLENSTSLIFLIAIYASIIFLIEISIGYLFLRYGSRHLQLTALATFIIVNVYALYSVHLNVCDIARLLYAVIFGLIFGTVTAVTKDTPKARFLVVLLMCIIPLVSLFNQSTYSQSNSSPSSSNKLKEFASLQMRSKPSIFLISFDAMISSALAQRYLSINKLPYEEYLKNLNNHVLKNSFVSQAPTIPSLNSIMKFDNNQDYLGDGYFSGLKPSPLSAFLRANGYHLETGASVPNYFGGAGPYVDKHTNLPNNIIEDSPLCKFASVSASYFGAFGVCNFGRFLTTDKLFDLEPVLKNPEAPYFDSEWHEYVISTLKAKPSETPTFKFFYYYYPIGHASNDFVSNDIEMLSAYRKRFVIQAQKAGEVISDIRNTVIQNNPNAIVLLFGDHGAKISRTVDLSKEKTFWVQDNHGVFLAILKTDNKCSSPDLAKYNQEFHTVGRVIAAIFRCLSESPEIFDGAMEFYDAYDFSDFLFE